MFLAGVDISKTAYFIKAQSVWKMVTKLIPYDDVTQFDGMYFVSKDINKYFNSNICCFAMKGTVSHGIKAYVFCLKGHKQTL